MQEIRFIIPYTLLDLSMEHNIELYNDGVDDFLDHGLKLIQFISCDDLDKELLVQAANTYLSFNSIAEVRDSVMEFIDYNHIPDQGDMDFYFNNIYIPSLLDIISNELTTVTDDMTASVMYEITDTCAISIGLSITANKI